jgi:hypothetical protein
MVKHTPGPRGRDKYGSMIDAMGESVILRGTTTLCSGSDDRMAIAEANTDLACVAPELLTDLVDAASQLRTYEALHRAKGTEESTAKAEVNAALAARFEATIARARGEA